MHGYRCDSGVDGRRVPSSMRGSCPSFVSVLLCQNKVRLIVLRAITVYLLGGYY